MIMLDGSVSYTYRHNTLQFMSLIDHVYIGESLKHVVLNVRIVEN